MQYLQMSLELLDKLVLPLLAYLAHRYIKNKTLQEAMLSLDSLASNVVSELKPKVRDLKDPNKPGAWSEEMGREFKKAAMAALRKQGASLLTVVQKAMFPGASADSYLSTLVEAQVEKQRETLLASRVGTLVSPEVEGASQR